ncbi:unnamed protein product, partial [Rotaria magnacalcarata]
KNQSRTTSGKQQVSEQCKQFIARLLYARLCREFRRCRYGTHHAYDVQLRVDIDRIFHCLQTIEQKLDGVDEKMLK